MFECMSTKVSDSSVTAHSKNSYVTPEALAAFQAALKRVGLNSAPDFHMVLGSGFGAALDSILKETNAWRLMGELSFDEIPGLPVSTVQDHAGKYRFVENTKTGKKIVFQSGRLHGYEGHSAREAVVPVMISRLAGTSRFLLSNAAGGIDRAHTAGDVMIIRDHVNMTGQNPLTGENPVMPNGRELGPRFPDLSQVYEPQWMSEIEKLLQVEGVKCHRGIYMGLLGPSFETPSEVELYGRWGVHAVGMSTVWEAIALKHSGAQLAGLSLISNAACGLGDGQPLDHEKILETCRASALRIVKGILKWLEK